jgi:hypothetical protein
MPTNYPSNLDTWPTIGPLLSSTPHSEVHEDLQDAVEAIQTELGTDPAGASATVRDRIAAVDVRVSQCRESYPDVASLPGSGDFVGQTVWVVDIGRQYSWDGTYWLMTGGSWPGCRLFRDNTHPNVPTTGATIDLSGHSGVAGGYRTGSIITIPAGAGGLYRVDFGAEFSQGVSAYGFQVGIVIASNSGIPDTDAPTQLVAAAEWEGVGTFPVFPVVGMSKEIALADGATITMTGSSTVASRGPAMSHISVRMTEHHPDWT